MVGEVKSSHCMARLMFAKAYRPFWLCSCSRLDRDSWGMTRDTKDELLLTMLLFGLRLLSGSFESLPLMRASEGLPSPKAGAW